MTEITWIPCSEQMPTDDLDLIINSTEDDRPSMSNKVCLDYCLFFHPDKTWIWTPYTEEKWKELNK